MGEQLSTWMDWIWSSRCFSLLFTSTQSSNLKWASGWGINSSRHQTSRWLKAVESSTTGWSDTMFFRESVHPVLLVVASTAHDRWHNCSDTIHQRCVGSSSAEGLVAKTSLLVSSWPSDGPTLPLTMVSVHPMLKASSWRVSILIQTEHRIDRQCPHSDRQIIQCYWLCCFCSAIHPTHLETGPSDHPTVTSSSCMLLRCVPSAPTLAPMVLSVHLTMSFSVLFFVSSTWIFAST
jgi:hypothetical protein